MFNFAKIAAVAAVALAFGASAADAQNWRLRPSFGTVNLSAGFLPDPVTRTVQAGGDQHFGGGGGCPGGGWFANAPDYRLQYRAGQYELAIYIRARGDTMLLVNDPSGQWFCNDDAQGLNPGLTFRNPRSGQYDIWAGTYNRSRVRGATLYITEMGAFSR